jgi:hypothetical protein
VATDVVTPVRRLLGLVMIAGGVAIYLDEAERGSFVCERATRTCLHSVERVGRPTTSRTFPLAEVLGAAYKWSYWEEAPGARDVLARARSMADVRPTEIYADRPTPRGRTSSSSPVVFTRHGLVPLIPGFPPGDGGPVSQLEGFVAGEGGDRIELVQDERLSGVPLALILGLVGGLLVWLRGPGPPP